MNGLKLSHPDASTLADFLSGLLGEEESSGIEQHIAACPSCCAALDQLPDDTLVQMLRGGGTFPALPAGLARAAGQAIHDIPTRSSDLSPVAESLQPPLVSGVSPGLVTHPRYRVVELLGRGGMGAVYKAEHRLMERAVALKILPAALLDNPNAVERFRRETKAAARLSHPNIVTAFDAEQAGEAHFLVMECVEGSDLAKYVKHVGPLPVSEACAYIRQAALGLQHAHERGMVHRDIKPQNLMRTPEGQIKVLDFGLARFVRESTVGPLTQADAVMGTPDYMAPEQANDIRSADIRADVYSLGCTLYFLLAGQPPFPGGTLTEKLLKHQQAAPADLSNFRPALPAGLADVVRKMMAKCPDERYPTPGAAAAALAPFADAERTAALQRIAEREATLVIPPPAVAPVNPGRRPNRKWLAAGAAAILVAGLVILVEITFKAQTDAPKPVANGKALATKPNDAQPDEPEPTKAGWEVQKSGVTDDLHDVAFLNEKVGVAVGYHQTILRTTDSGKTWARAIERVKDGPRLNSVIFANDKLGYAVTSIVGTILHSKDSGATWTKMPLPGPAEGVHTLAGKHYCTHAVHGSSYYFLCWGLSGTRLFKTDNAGQDWEERRHKLNLGSLAGGSNGIAFPDGKHGCFVSTRPDATQFTFTAGVTEDDGT